MKKVIFCLAAAFCVVVSANAQDAGQWWVGGTVGISVDSPDVGDNTTDFIIMPEVGYQLNDMWGVGIALGYGQDDLGGDSKDKLFNVEAFARLSFLRGGIGNLFVEGGVGFANAKQERPSVADGKENTITVGFRPGVNVNISDNLSLIGKFGFLGWAYETESKDNAFGLNVNPANDLQLGLIFKF